MNHANKRKKRAQLAIIYTLMILTVISIVAVAILVLQGYRYNRYDGRLEQGGLVQFNSRPTGSAVTVDDLTLANKTPSKITLSTGAHDITVSREGYTTWKKAVTVKAGGVLWLNYVQLMPVAPQTKTVGTYTTVTSPLYTPNHKEVAFLQAASDPTITMMTLDTNTPEAASVFVPSTAYTSKLEDGQQSTFSLIAWDKGNRYLIMKHTYGDKAEYISVDTDDPSRSRNLSAVLGVDIANVCYSLADSGTVYILTSAHELRRADIYQATLSGPLVSNVSSIVMTDRDIVMYTTLPDETGVRSVGYLSSGLTTPKQLTTVAKEAADPLLATTGSYYGERYIAIAHADTVDIVKTSLGASDSKAPVTLKKVASVPFAGGAEYIGFSPGENRFVYVAKGTKIVTYDLELFTVSTLTLPAPLTQDVKWMDGYHIIATDGEKGYFYDYDGTNGQQFAANTTTHPAMLASGEKYLYYFQQYTTQMRLQRVKMTTD